MDCIKEIFNQLSFGRHCKEIIDPMSKEKWLVFWKFDLRSIGLPEFVLKGEKSDEKEITEETKEKLATMIRIGDLEFHSLVQDIYKIALCCKTFYMATTEKRKLLFSYSPFFEERKKNRLEQKVRDAELAKALESERQNVEKDIGAMKRDVEGLQVIFQRLTQTTDEIEELTNEKQSSSWGCAIQ